MYSFGRVSSTREASRESKNCSPLKKLWEDLLTRPENLLFNNYRFVTAFYSLSVISVAWCRKAYQTFIPNGDRIPHPCGDDHVWGGVGHYRPGGGGQRNPFGEDFAANSLVSSSLFIVQSTLVISKSKGPSKTLRDICTSTSDF